VSSGAHLSPTLVAIVLVQPAALLWVLIRRRGMWLVLLINMLFAVGVLALVAPDLPAELRYIRAGEATELFEYKNTIATVFETVTLLASGLAYRGSLLGKIVAWFGFAGNFVLSLVAVWFALTFTFKCCGYL